MNTSINTTQRWDIYELSPASFYRCKNAQDDSFNFLVSFSHLLIDDSQHAMIYAKLDQWMHDYNEAHPNARVHYRVIFHYLVPERLRIQGPNQWPHSIVRGRLEANQYSDSTFVLRDAQHGIPVLGNVTSVTLTNYPTQIEFISNELVKRWNAYYGLVSLLLKMRDASKELNGCIIQAKGNFKVDDYKARDAIIEANGVISQVDQLEKENKLGDQLATSLVFERAMTIAGRNAQKAHRQKAEMTEVEQALVEHYQATLDVNQFCRSSESDEEWTPEKRRLEVQAYDRLHAAEHQLGLLAYPFWSEANRDKVLLHNGMADGRSTGILPPLVNNDDW